MGPVDGQWRTGGTSPPQATVQNKLRWITSANPVPGLCPLLEWLESQGPQSNSKDNLLLWYVTQLLFGMNVTHPHLQVHKQYDRLPLQSQDGVASDMTLTGFQKGLILLSLELFTNANELTPAIC